MHLLHAHQTVTHAPPRAHSYGRGLFIGPSGTQRADRDYENWDKEGRSKSIKKQMMDGRNVTPSNPDATVSSRLVKLCCCVSFNRSLHGRWDHSAVKGSWLFPFIILEYEIRSLFQPAKILVASATPRHSGLKKTPQKNPLARPTWDTAAFHYLSPTLTRLFAGLYSRSSKHLWTVCLCDSERIIVCPHKPVRTAVMSFNKKPRPPWSHRAVFFWRFGNEIHIMANDRSMQN